VFQVHKAIICSRSPFFRGLFTSGLRESKMNTITLDIDNPKVLEAILEYMYLNEIDFSSDYQDIILDIFVTANKYQVLGCTEYLEDIISNNIEIDNVLSLALLADREKANKLLRCCKDFISSEKHIDFIFDGNEYRELKNQIDLLFGPEFYFETKRMIEIKKEEEEKQNMLRKEIESNQGKTEEKTGNQNFLARLINLLRARNLLQENDPLIAQFGNGDENGDENENNNGGDGNNGEDDDDESSLDSVD